MVVYFLNTYLLYSIAPFFATWDFRDKELSSFFDKLFSGIYNDFNPQWFEDVGSLIVGLMMTNIYKPWVNFAKSWVMRNFARSRDQGNYIIADDLR